MTFTNTEFVTFLKKMVGRPYWYGTCVFKCTETLLQRKAKQYPKYYAESRMAKYRKAIAENEIATDCVGLGKGFFWTNGGAGIFEAIGTDASISNVSGRNGVPDKSANGMFTYAKSIGRKYGPIETLPEIEGLAVRHDGHVGFYIGNGKVIEAKGFNYGVVISDLKKGNWTDWYEFPEIIYMVNGKPVSDLVTAPVWVFGSRTLRKGMEGTDVRELQQLLQELGYALPKFGADGGYGEETFNAIKAYQADNGLDADGICGKKTFAKLQSQQGSTLDGKEKEPTTHTTLRKGARGDEVKVLQQALNCGLEIDGIFGSATFTAVKEYQEKMGLKVDGIVGKATWASLGV